MTYLKPIISVVMPVYNGELYVSEAIDSILNQDFQNFEFIIINDGSTDLSHIILSDYSKRDPRIMIKTLDSNLGLPQALNLGLNSASGEFIARMDADDIADSTRLTLQLKAFHDDPQLIACGTNYRTFGEQVNDIKTPQSDRHCKAILLIRSCFAHPTVMLRRRALVNNHLLYRDLGQAEDYDLWSRLAPFGKFRNLPQILLHYRIHSKQVSVEHTKDQQERHAQIASQNLSKVGLSLSPKRVSHLLWPSERNPILYLMKAFNFAFQLMFKSKGVNRISIIKDIFRIAINQASSMLFH